MAPLPSCRVPGVVSARLVPIRCASVAASALLLATGFGCTPQPAVERQGPASLVSLADRLDAAEVDSSGPPALAGTDLRWSFQKPQATWYPFGAGQVGHFADAGLEPIEDGVRLSLGRKPSSSFILTGGLAIDLEDAGHGGLRVGDWETVAVRARSSHRLAGITIAYNYGERGALPNNMQFLQSTDEVPPVFSDGSEQVYAIPLRPRDGSGSRKALENLAVLVGSTEPSSIDILEIALVPRGAAFRDDYGVRSVVRDGETRRTLFAHTPARLSYRVEVPAGARLDVGLGASAGEAVTYRVHVATGETDEQLFEETVEGAGAWRQSTCLLYTSDAADDSALV